MVKVVAKTKLGDRGSRLSTLVFKGTGGLTDEWYLYLFSWNLVHSKPYHYL